MAYVAGTKNGVHTQLRLVDPMRTTGLRGIFASGMPLKPITHCETRKCKNAPIIRATDAAVRLAYCTKCWPVGNA